MALLSSTAIHGVLGEGGWWSPAGTPPWQGLPHGGRFVATCLRCRGSARADANTVLLMCSTFPCQRLFLFQAVKRVKKGIVSIMVIKLPGNSLIRLIKSK